MNARAPIPEAIKRQIRQQCGFGCAICGMPVFEYDHIVHYSQVLEHNPDNLVLLCATHHSAKTTGKLSEERVRNAKKQPFNRTRQRTAGYKLEPSANVKVLLGSNEAFWAPSAANDTHAVVSISGTSYLSLHAEAEGLTFSATLTDATPQAILTINRGELVAAVGIWDYRYEGTRLQVRAGPGVIVLDLSLSDGAFVLHRGQFLDEHGDGFVVRDGVLMTMRGGVAVDMLVGCKAGYNSAGAFAVYNAAVATLPPAGGFGFYRGW